MTLILFPDGLTWLSLLPFLMVFLGAVLQMTTGVGLGLIAGPFLLFVMDAPQAIQTAILLNLFLSAVVLPAEGRSVDLAALKRLSIWALLGIPLGALFLVSVAGDTLKLVSGAVVLLALFQLKFLKPTPQNGHVSFALGGAISGIMTGALAIPGPVALWTLLSAGLDPEKTRATLRAYFVVAYLAAFLGHAILTGIRADMLLTFACLAPPVLAGIAAGMLMRRRLSMATLRFILEMVLLLMGASLLGKGLIGF